MGQSVIDSFRLEIAIASPSFAGCSILSQTGSKQNLDDLCYLYLNFYIDHLNFNEHEKLDLSRCLFYFVPQTLIFKNAARPHSCERAGQIFAKIFEKQKILHLIIPMVVNYCNTEGVYKSIILVIVGGLDEERSGWRHSR